MYIYLQTNHPQRCIQSIKQILWLHEIKALIFSLCHFTQAPILPKIMEKKKISLPISKGSKDDSQGYWLTGFCILLGIKVKYLGPMIPSKGLQGVPRKSRRTQLSPRLQKAVPNLIVSSAPEEIFFWLAVTKPVVLIPPTTFPATTQLDHH